METDNRDDLAFEVATNRRYLTALKELAARRRTPAVSISANERWLENVPHAGPIAYGPLVARVGLGAIDEDLGSAFYIGARWLSGFDHPVVSWAAPVAKIFYEPGVDSHELADHVIVRRTLLERLHDIVKVFDVWDVATDAAQSPFAARELQLPSAPPASRRRREQVDLAAAEDAPVPAPSPSTSDLEAVRDVSRPTRKSEGTTVLRRGMRSAEAVEYALRAPRSEALTSVLSTLQPDQYRLVTHPGHDQLVVQGHPGTGKTIVAIHRAAYLVSPDREDDLRVRRLLILGPTEEWVRHVSGIVKTLDVDSRISVRSLPAWLAEIADFKHQLSGELDGSVEDVGKFVKDVLDRAAALSAREQAWATGPGARVKNLERLYDIVRNEGTGLAPLRLGPISSTWVKTLPTFGAAIRRKRYLPLFAQATVSILGRPPVQYDHVVVDEAQDVAGLEWEIIRAHNATSMWTLVGDMNQRRTDFGDSSWGGLLERLQLDAGQVKPQVIERGYRSTQAILDFAKPLLPRTERAMLSLQQDGPAPTVTRATKAAERDATAVSEAERLLHAHPNGTVAAIAVEMDIPGVEKALLGRQWRRGTHAGDWRKDDRVLALRTPETARGVEFDGVVVVEPGAFPRNLGRVGPLYTSLTRANRELAVVHHAALPDALRRHARRQ